MIVNAVDSSDFGSVDRSARSARAARGTRPVFATIAAMVLCAWALLGGVGCVGYATYPPMEGLRGFKNPNSDPLPALMKESVKWVSTRYPPTAAQEWSAPPRITPGEDPKFVVNLPAGVNRAIYLAVARDVGPSCLPMEPGLENLPTYHVAQMWVQGDEAKVDIIRPVPGVGGGNSPSDPTRQITQGITVRLRGGMQRWHVTSHNVWTIGARPVPPINYVPEK